MTFSIEKYLTNDENKAHKNALTKFRLFSHDLLIETEVILV